MDSYNHRILKVRPGEEKGEIFFGGKGSGSDLDQLKYPQGITFYKDHAYIVDSYSSRILKVRPGEERGEIFFGGEGTGSGLDQLNSPQGITFYKDHAYIVDSYSSRILKVRPGEEKGEIFFQGTGPSSTFGDLLAGPQGITFYKGNAYIVDSFNHRILVVDMPQKELLQFHQALRVSSMLSSCRSVREASYQESTIFLADCKGLALPQSAWDTLLPPNFSFFVQLTHQVFNVRLQVKWLSSNQVRIGPSRVTVESNPSVPRFGALPMEEEFRGVGRARSSCPFAQRNAHACGVAARGKPPGILPAVARSHRNPCWHITCHRPFCCSWSVLAGCCHAVPFLSIDLSSQKKKGLKDATFGAKESIAGKTIKNILPTRNLVCSSIRSKEFFQTCLHCAGVTAACFEFSDFPNSFGEHLTACCIMLSAVGLGQVVR